MVRRMYMPTGPMIPPSRKGIRQPQLPMSAGVITVLSNAATPEPSSSPATTLVCWKLP